MNAKHKLLLFFAIVSLTTFAKSKSPEAVDFEAAGTIAKDMASWIKGMEDGPDSVAIYTLNTHEPFDFEFGNVLEAEIMSALRKKGIKRVSSCMECRMAQVTVHQSEVVISKGAPDIDAVRRVGQRIPVDSLLVVELYRTRFAVVAHAILYSNPEGDLLGTERFNVAALQYEDTAVQFMMTFGMGSPSMSDGSAVDPDGLKLSGNLHLLEEMGFAKGGLTLGAVLTPNGTLIHLLPTIGFRGRFGNTSLRWGLNLGVGYGISGDARGVTGRAALELYVGSWAVIGGEYIHTLATANATAIVQSYMGVHVGVSFGR